MKSDNIKYDIISKVAFSTDNDLKVALEIGKSYDHIKSTIINKFIDQVEHHLRNKYQNKFELVNQLDTQHSWRQLLLHDKSWKSEYKVGFAFDYKNDYKNMFYGVMTGEDGIDEQKMMLRNKLKANKNIPSPINKEHDIWIWYREYEQYRDWNDIDTLVALYWNADQVIKSIINEDFVKLVEEFDKIMDQTS